MLMLLLKDKAHTSALRPASDEPLLPGATEGIQAPVSPFHTLDLETLAHAER